MTSRLASYLEAYLSLSTAEGAAPPDESQGEEEEGANEAASSREGDDMHHGEPRKVGRIADMAEMEAEGETEAEAMAEAEAQAEGKTEVVQQEGVEGLQTIVCDPAWIESTEADGEQCDYKVVLEPDSTSPVPAPDPNPNPNLNATR